MLDVEDKNSGDLWRGDFSSKYVEDVTAKTGCFKKFAVFAKMLLSAMKQQSSLSLENVDP